MVTRAAMTDGQGPGAHALYQDFVVPASGGSATLNFSLFVGNRADGFYTPATPSLDFSTPELNQQARVDIMRPVDPFSVAAPDILLNVYQTSPGDALVSGYTALTADLTALFAAHPGETLRLRFAETDNVFMFQLGVDDVDLDVVPVPEPALLLLMTAGMVAAVFAVGVSRRPVRGSVDLLEGGMNLTGVAGTRKTRHARWVFAVAGALVLAGAGPAPILRADTTPVTILDPNLQVTTVLGPAAGLLQPIGIVFLNGADDFLVLEKASGQIKRVIGGVVQPTPVLDLAVNSNSERGLLSMVLHPGFPTTPYAYVRWTASSTGADTGVVSDVPLLGNRVDRFAWSAGTGTLVFDRNIAMLRSRQTDNVAVAGHPGTNNANEAGNHNGGVMRFGPDGKLYVFMGDQGRRGWLQNLANGPFLTPPNADDTFGGPESDNAHLTGVILRLNDDGTVPADNPFFAAGAAFGGEVGANLQRLFSYGHRNGFGMAFDPYSGALWETENGDDSFSELNRVIPGMNGGWIQVAGPLARMAQFKTIETTQFSKALQQGGIRQRAWRTRGHWRSRGCSCCRAQPTWIPNSAGSTRLVPPAPRS